MYCLFIELDSVEYWQLLQLLESDKEKYGSILCEKNQMLQLL